ncbi:MAG: hypothetical protein AB7S38_22730 [Vulcanimicrobiota bacterium]
MKKTFLLLTSLLFLSMLAWADPEDAFEAGNRALEAKNYQEALEFYRQSLAEGETESTLWNAGLAAYLSGQAEAALEYWSKLKQFAPDDLRLRGKLIQAYELKGDKVNRDRERAELVELWRSSRADDDEPFFCRDQFQAGGNRVMVFENYELEGPRAVKYTFIVLQPEVDEEDYRISLGSYDVTNQLAHELGEVAEGERAYHLDGYYDEGARHATFEMFKKEPDYDTVKAMVVEILEGKREAVSSSERG